MKAAEFLIGSLLVTSGVIGPSVFDAGGLVLDETLEGQAEFVEANYTGSAQLGAADAALRALGPIDTSLPVDGGTLTIYEYTEHRVTVGQAGLTAAYRGDVDVTRKGLENATVHLEGQPDSQVDLWSNRTLAPSWFELDLEPMSEGSIFASPRDADFQVAWWTFDREYEAPVFGLGDGADLSGPGGSPHLMDANFRDLHVTGGVDAIILNTTLVVEQDGKQERYDTGTWQTSGGPLPGAPATKRAIAVLSYAPTALRLDLEGLDSVFATNEPVWRINGTVSFEADAGRLTTANQTRPVDNAEVEIVGNTTMDLRARGGEDDPPGVPPENHDMSLPSSLLPRPSIQAALQSQADRVTVDGQAMEMASPDPVTDQVTFWSKIVGALVIAWAVAKHVLAFAVGLLIRDPLDNDRRQRIYAYLQEVSIAHTRDIKRAVDLPMGPVSYHLRVLKSAGLVANVRRAGYQVWFVPTAEFGWDEMEALALLVDPTRRRIAEALGCKQAVTQQALAECLDLHVSSVSRQLSTLEEADLVTHENGGRERTYSPAELLKRWLDKHGGARGPGSAQG